MIGGLILAGGRSRRFGREKALALLDGEPLIGHVERALARGLDRLAVSAAPGSAAEAYAAARKLTCLADNPTDPVGPLAGIKAGLRWARGEEVEWLATSPCDTPFLPLDLVARLVAANGSRGAVAKTTKGVHPLCALWPVASLEYIEDVAGHPPIRLLLETVGAAEVAFEDADAFANLNTPQDFGTARPREPRGALGEDVRSRAGEEAR